MFALTLLVAQSTLVLSSFVRIGGHVRYNRRENTGGQQSQVSLSAPKAAEPSTMPFAQRLTVKAASKDVNLYGLKLTGASCDILVASTAARFGLPEVDNGALGCASHLAKLVPPFKLRQMTFTCEAVSASQLYEWGTVYKLCEPEALLQTAIDTAEKIVTKLPRVVRAAKAALNHIDVFDLAKHYRIEQGYTYEMNLFGDGDRARDAFLSGTRQVTKDADR